MKTLPDKGTWVHLIKDGSKQAAQVQAHMDQKHYPGGIRLDRRIGGFQYWNMEDVCPAQAPQ